VKGTTHKDMAEEIVVMCEDEYVRLQQAIQQEDQQLRELEENWVLLKRKSSLLDAEVKKLERKLKEVFLHEKPRIVQPNVGENHLLLLSLSYFNNNKICLQYCTGTDLY